MEHYKTKLFFVACFLFSLLLGCDKLGFRKPKEVGGEKEKPVVVKGTVIAKVNNLPITLEELNKYVDIYNVSIDQRKDLSEEEKKSLKIDTREKKISYLKEGLIRQGVFYQLALDHGLDRKEEILDILEKNKVVILAKAMEEEVIKTLDVSSVEIEDAYNKNKNLFKEPEARNIREIVVKTEDEAKQIHIELLQGGDFATLAKTRSIADSAQKEGELGFIRKGERGEKFAAFDDVVFSPALQKGAISSVFKGPDGYYVVKIEDIREGKQLSLSELWETLKTLILSNKQKEALDSYYSRATSEGKIKIEIHEGEIK